jgi:tetratricopeptide (TPR) repeat protein
MEKDMEPKLRWALQFALGYMNLGMPDEAVRELAALNSEQQLLPEVMSLKAQAFLLQSDWAHAVTVAEAGHDRYPDMVDFYVQQALAYEQLGEPQRAISVWQASPEPVRGSGFCHYNIARCEMRLGNLASARRHVQQAIKLEPSLKAKMREDPFLSALPKALSQLN